MRLLLITDTHGRLDHIEALALAKGCEAVIHAGDLGFYDDHSVDRLSDRELSLRIIHSELPENEKRDMLSLSLDKKADFVRNRLPLSQLPQYLKGEQSFNIPIFAVWGNHEDTEVVKKFCTGEYAVPNLRVLHGKSTFRLGGCHIFGIGGNLLRNRKFFQKPIAGGGGRVWTTLSQCLDLIGAAESQQADSDIRILVSHVSPGKEGLISLLGACVGASVLISGHMAPPYALCWNECAIREPDESTRRLQRSVEDVCTQAEQLDQAAREGARRLEDSLVRCQRETVSVGRGVTAPRWYRDMLYINLPDCDAGHAVLALEQGSIRLETCATFRGTKAGAKVTDLRDARQHV